MSSSRAASLNIHHQSESLLFQFILSEFIDSHSEVLTIHRLSRNLNAEVMPSLKSSVAKLAGSTQSYMRLFSWSQEDGILSRLKNYCGTLSLQNKSQNETILKMQQHINQAFLGCVQSLDTIQMAEDINESEEYMRTLSKLLDKIVSPMQRFSKLTADLMQEFHKDENVLFFMLKHQADLDQLYGSQFVFKLMNRMYPQGLDALSKFLLKRYKLRGFDHILPRIRKKIAELHNS